MRSRWVKRVLIAFALLDLVPLGVLVLSFQPPLFHYLTRHGLLSLVVVRTACVLALAALALLVVARRHLERLLATLDRHVERVVATEGVTPPTLDAPVSHTVVVMAAALVAVVAVALAVAAPTQYQSLIREDGPIEYGSSALWFAAALCAMGGLLVDRRRLSWKAAVYLPMVAFSVMCGGEEISWGQRILRFQTPQLLQEVNKQREFNLHDIGSISVYENLFFVGAVLCCLVLPLVLERAPRWRAYLRHLNAPIIDPRVGRAFGIGLAAWLVVGLRFGTLGFSPLSLWGYYSQLDDELFEFFAAYGFGALAALDLTHRLAGGTRWKHPVPSTVSY